MMNTGVLPKITSIGNELDLRAPAFGELRRTNDIVNDGNALRKRLAEDGYLFLPGLLSVGEVQAARQFVVDQLAELGLLDEAHDRLLAVHKVGVNRAFAPECLTQHNHALQQVLYHGAMLEFYTRLLGGPVRFFNYTWFRVVTAGGHGTYPHCDVVYMGRGTFQLYTSWTPIGNISLATGGLMILENSHRQQDKLRNYLQRDVDTYCTNGKMQPDWDGRLASNPVALREKLGGRWLTTEYQMGDVLVFGMGTVHASLDNQSNGYRLSADSRYQLASEPVDERWIGANPLKHGSKAKRGRIC